MEKHLKRISLMIRDDQSAKVSEKGLNLSGLVRDLLDDHFSEHKITLSVSEESYALYDKVISNTGATDADIEPYLKQVLRQLLADRILAMQKLHADLSAD